MAKSPYSSPARHAGPNLLLLAFVGWLFPGSGLLLLGRRYVGRAILFMGAVYLTFFLGICLNGGVSWPVWGFRDPGFNVVNNLNFILQLGCGWPALLAWVADAKGWAFLTGDEIHPLSELGGFYCMVAGALNYFIVWDGIERSDKKAFEILAKQ